jgi:hypothetical protein
VRLPYAVTINSCANGYIVSVGCQTFVFNDRATLLEELRGYLENPQETVTGYSEKYGIPIVQVPEPQRQFEPLVGTASALNERYVPGPALNQCQERRR